MSNFYSSCPNMIQLFYDLYCILIWVPVTLTVHKYKLYNTHPSRISSDKSSMSITANKSAGFLRNNNHKFCKDICLPALKNACIFWANPVLSICINSTKYQECTLKIWKNRRKAAKLRPLSPKVGQWPCWPWKARSRSPMLELVQGLV